MLFNCDLSSDQQATENIVQNETKPMDEEEIEDTTMPSTTRTVTTNMSVTTVITARQTTEDITTTVSNITTTVLLPSVDGSVTRCNCPGGLRVSNLADF